MKLITNAEQVLANIDRLQQELTREPELIERLGLAHAWYVDTRTPHQPRFGFSKFVGYQNLDAETYLKKYNQMDGRNTEWVLKDYFEELDPDSAAFQHYHQELSDWLGSLGRTPRKKVRLMALKPEYRGEAPDEDRSLLELMVAVSKMLPPHHRLELRNKL